MRGVTQQKIRKVAKYRKVQLLAILCDFGGPRPPPPPGRPPRPTGQPGVGGGCRSVHAARGRARMHAAKVASCMHREVPGAAYTAAAAYWDVPACPPNSFAGGQ